MAQALCPNCRQRPPDTNVDFDEVVKARYSRGWSILRGRILSFSSTTRYGHTLLCAPCARHYRRMVQWRTLGWKVSNAGLVGLFLSAVFFAFVVETPALKTSWLAYFAG